MNSYCVVHASAQKITETAKSLKIYYVSLMIFLLILYVDELKWHISSNWALLNVLLANGIKIYHLHSCWWRTFWAHAVTKQEIW